MTIDGALTILHSFAGSIDDSGVPGSFVQGPDGNFYGTTSVYCSGRVFRMTRDGTVTTAFPIDLSDGDYSCVSLPDVVQGRDGNLYGTTLGQPKGNGPGVLYRIDEQGRITILHELSIGYRPPSLAQGSDGSFYLLMPSTILKVTRDGREVFLHRETSVRELSGGLIQGIDGDLFAAFSTFDRSLISGIFRLRPVPGLPGQDFNDDGKPDLVWQNDTTRQASVWNMSGAGGDVFQAWNWLTSTGVSGWSIVATGDFNHDGTPDLVWQNDVTRQVSVWYMGGAEGTTLLGWNWLSANGVPGWRVVAVADFDLNGIPDLVWQNDITRQVTVWYQFGDQGNVFLSWNWLSSMPVPGWRVVAVHDMNGDAHPDLIWQNDTTRQVTVWYFGGTYSLYFRGWSWLAPNPIPGWTIVGAADFNSDNVPDLVWQNDATRQVSVWYMGGALGNQFLGWNYLSSAGVPGWHAIVR
jgi:uncharacterized repeat protein (TIGR03803 family)